MTSAQCNIATGGLQAGTTKQAVTRHFYVSSFQPVFHDWCNKGRGMCYPVCGMVYIKELLLLIGKIAHMAAAGFFSHYQNGP